MFRARCNSTSVRIAKMLVNDALALICLVGLQKCISSVVVWGVHALQPERNGAFSYDLDWRGSFKPIFLFIKQWSLLLFNFSRTVIKWEIFNHLIAWLSLKFCCSCVILKLIWMHVECTMPTIITLLEKKCLKVLFMHSLNDLILGLISKREATLVYGLC